MHDAIHADGLVKRFGATAALDGLRLAVPAGTVLALLGPNGAGKTTAVRILTTLLKPDAGHATVCGWDVTRQAHRVRQVIALTGQYAAVDENLTGFENLLMIARLLGLPRREARRRAAELLDRFDLAGAGGRAVRGYSGGMRRRLDLAASLVTRPRVLFLDEPTTGLDPRARAELWQAVRELAAGGVAVLLTTQYLEEADQLADQVTVVDRGRAVASGTPDQLKARVGGQVLEVRPARAADLATVVEVVAGLAGAAPQRADGAVRAPVADPALPAAVLGRLAGAGVPVAELAVRKPSLDEVFFALTGHRAGGAGARGPAGHGLERGAA